MKMHPEESQNILEKIENNIKYSEKIGIKNESSFTPINNMGDKGFRC